MFFTDFEILLLKSESDGSISLDKMKDNLTPEIRIKILIVTNIL
jgi:hypothetical protein